MDKVFQLFPPGESQDANWDTYFELAWRGRACIFEQMTAGGETSLARLLALYERFGRRHDTGVRVEAGRLTGEVSFIERAAPADGWALERLDAVAPGMILERSVQVPALLYFDLAGLLADFADGCDAVVELGSGYGLQLFRLFLGGGPRHARYIGGEASPAGRALAQRLAALEPAMDFESRNLNLAAMNLGFLMPYRRILLFTAWSAMYLTATPAHLFEALAALPGEVWCVFCEPFGGQIDAGDIPGRRLAEEMHKGGLNGDFYREFNRAAAKGVIEPLHVARNVFAAGDDPFAALSILACRTVKG